MALAAIVKYNQVPAGMLEKKEGAYLFTYLPEYIAGRGRPVSITMPLRKEPYQSKILFPVFTNLLSEGANKRMQTRLLKIADNDYFNLLLATARFETIGPLTVSPIQAP